MKKEFSKAWKASKQPRKQRKYLANAPIHLKKKKLSVNLSKALRDKHSIRNIPVKKGDTVKILRGKYSGKQGKITQVKLKIGKVCIEKIKVKKTDGTNVDVKMQPSNLQIIELNLEDKKRNKAFVTGKETTSEKKVKTSLEVSKNVELKGKTKEVKKESKTKDTMENSK